MRREESPSGRGIECLGIERRGIKRKRTSTSHSKINLLIDSGGRGKALRLSIPRWLWKTLYVGVLVLLTLGGAFIAYNALTIDECERLQERKLNTLERIAELKETASDQVAVLYRMEQHDLQIRILMDMEVLPSDVRALGIGGSDEEDPELAALRELNSPHYAEINTLSREVDWLVRKANYQSESFAEVENQHYKDREMWDHIPSIVPTTGRFSGRYGYRRDPILGIRKKHCGVDISNTIGTPVIAPADGTVLFAGRLTGYGIVVKINHGYGIVTVYAHLSQSYVESGDEVSRYDTIAAIGNTGRTVGPHLHYEVRVAGKTVNPEGYFLDADEVFRGQSPETWPRFLPQK